MDDNDIKIMARQLIRMNRKQRMLAALFKTDGGHLTPAGKAIIQQGIEMGIAQSKIAGLLDITPAAVSYHAP